LQQLAANPSIGHGAMCTAIKSANGVTFKHAPIRKWLAAHKGARPMPAADAASSSSAPSMALLQLSHMEQYDDFLRQQLSEVPDITVAQLRDKLIQGHAVSCLEHTMQTWLERARATVPKRAIKRGSSDLPTLENLEEHGDYLRGLLEDDATMGRVQLRESMKKKGFLVSEKTMRCWLDRYHGIRALFPYEAALLQYWFEHQAMTYTQGKEFLEQKHGVICSKATIMQWMQSPFLSMDSVSIDALRGYE